MKKQCLTLLVAVGMLQLMSALGAADTLAQRLHTALADGELAAAALSWELGLTRKEQSMGMQLSAPGADEPDAAVLPTQAPAPTPQPAPTPEVQPVPTPVPTATPAPEVLSTVTVSEAETAVFPDTEITNRTGLSPDIAALMAQTPDVHLPASGPQILIIHTHGTEAYTPSPGCEYTESDEYRTTDCQYNVVRVGEELCRELTAQGLHVVHDTGLYDYPSYTGSYTRSGTAVENWLQQYPDIAVVIDLHRDALGSADAVYKTRAELSAEASAQVMLLIGTGENGLAHPAWQENFKLALRLQDAMDRSTPTLARPIDLVCERYNQHYTTGSMILEVGSSGNTLPEALCAIRLFARAAGPVFLSLVESAV